MRTCTEDTIRSARGIALRTHEISRVRDYSLMDDKRAVRKSSKRKVDLLTIFPPERW